MKRSAVTVRSITLRRLIAETTSLFAALMLGFPVALGAANEKAGGKDSPTRGFPAPVPVPHESHESTDERSEGEGEERSNERTDTDEDPVVWQLNQSRSRHPIRIDGTAAYGSAPDTHHNKTNPQVPSTSSAAQECRNGIGCPLRC